MGICRRFEREWVGGRRGGGQGVVSGDEVVL